MRSEISRAETKKNESAIHINAKDVKESPSRCYALMCFYSAMMMMTTMMKRIIATNRTVKHITFFFSGLFFRSFNFSHILIRNIWFKSEHILV